jgi:hypothetical protein
MGRSDSFATERRAIQAAISLSSRFRDRDMTVELGPGRAILAGCEGAKGRLSVLLNLPDARRPAGLGGKQFFVAPIEMTRLRRERSLPATAILAPYMSRGFFTNDFLLGFRSGCTKS